MEYQREPGPWVLQTDLLDDDGARGGGLHSMRQPEQVDPGRNAASERSQAVLAGFERRLFMPLDQSPGGVQQLDPSRPGFRQTEGHAKIRAARRIGDCAAQREHRKRDIHPALGTELLRPVLAPADAVGVALARGNGTILIAQAITTICSRESQLLPGGRASAPEDAGAETPCPGALPRERDALRSRIGVDQRQQHRRRTARCEALRPNTGALVPGHDRSAYSIGCDTGVDLPPRGRHSQASLRPAREYLAARGQVLNRRRTLVAALGLPHYVPATLTILQYEGIVGLQCGRWVAHQCPIRRPAGSERRVGLYPSSEDLSAGENVRGAIVVPGKQHPTRAVGIDGHAGAVARRVAHEHSARGPARGERALKGEAPNVVCAVESERRTRSRTHH